MNETLIRDLLAFLDSRLNDLMFSLYWSRQTLTAIQQQGQADAALLGRVGEALAAVRESERMLAEIQQRIVAVRRAT